MSTGYKLATFDVNFVLTKTHSIIDLADYVGTREQVDRYIKGHTSGMISMSTALAEACKQLKGVRHSQVVEHAKSMEITEGAQEMVKALKDAGISLAMITTGFKTTMDILNKRLGNSFRYIVANELVFENGAATGEIKFSVMENEWKADIVRDLATREGIDMDQTVAVGDSMGDQNMLDAAELGIAFNPNQALMDYATKYDISVVKDPDLRKIIPIILTE